MTDRTAGAESSTGEWVDDFVERSLAAWNPPQPERVLELMADDVSFDDSARSQTMRGPAEVRQFIEFLRRAFTVEAVGGPLVASDDARAAFWWRCRMTNTGPIDPPGIPATGKTVEYQGADFDEYRDGKVAHLRVLYDTADVFRQLGLIPGCDDLAGAE